MNAIPNKIKPVAGYTTIKDIVNAALIGMYDDSGSMKLRLEHWAIRGWKEELSIDVIRETKKVFLPVMSNTKTVKIPYDCLSHVVIGVVDTSNKLHQLSENNTITPPLIDDSETKPTCGCECGCTGELCADLLSIATTEEVTELGTKVIKTQTCKDGSVIQEITEPTTVTTPINTCNYSISLNTTCNSCTYTALVDHAIGFPFTNVYYKKNGEQINLGAVEDYSELDSIMAGEGFTVTTVDHSEQYQIEDTCDVYSDLTLINNVDPTQTIEFDITECSDVSTLTFPITIIEYVKNNEVVESGIELVNQTDMDNFFIGLGFTIDDVATYSIEETTNSFASITFIENDITQTLTFIPTDCVITYNYTVENITKTINVCNLAVKPCGCPVDTPENIAVCEACFGCYPGCWNNWCGWDESEFPTPDNNYGTYEIIKELGLIQLSPSNFPYKKIYFEYYSDGFGANGQYYIPSVAKPALIAYCHWQAIENKRGVALWEKERKSQNFVGERARAKKRISRVTLQQIYDSIRTLPVI